MTFPTDLTPEISLQSTRSGGKGGQNVNKVETAVVASLDIRSAQALSEEQKEILFQKLANRINKEGHLIVKAQTFRTQLENREEAVRRIHELVENALRKKKSRIATKPSKASRVKREESKKRNAEKKSGRRRLRPGDY